MRLIFLLITLVLLMLSPAAYASESSAILISVDTNESLQIISAPSGELVAEFSYEEDIDPQASISPDQQWVAFYNYSPPMLYYGRIGEPLSSLPIADDNYRMNSANFSPNGRYLSYTLAVEYEWVLGFIDLLSGTRTEFIGPPVPMGSIDLDRDANFGSMVASVVAWSPDAQSIYLESYIQFWGCRGPHSLYMLETSQIATGESGETMPEAQLLANSPDSNVFDYQFSPDMSQLAYVFVDDGACDAENTVNLGLIDLATRQTTILFSRELDAWDMQEPQTRILGWEGNRLVFQANHLDIVSVDVDTGILSEPQSLEWDIDMYNDAIWVSGALFYSGYENTLYHFSSSSEAILSASNISMQACGEMLYILGSNYGQGGNYTLYSRSLMDANPSNNIIFTWEDAVPYSERELAIYLMDCVQE